MTTDSINFEPTRSFCYRFTRYTLLPELAEEVKNLSGSPFLLRDVAAPIIGKYITPEQLNTKIAKAKTEGEDSIAGIFRYYVYFLAKGLNLFIPLGKGHFRERLESDVPEINEDEQLEIAEESGDAEAAEFDGWIYAYSFPMIMKENADFPIKIGKTINDVAKRIADQVSTKGSAFFEQPKILKQWQVQRVSPTELAAHNILKARGKWRENAPGQEWFDTTLAEIEAIMQFVTPPKTPSS